MLETGLPAGSSPAGWRYEEPQQPLSGETLEHAYGHHHHHMGYGPAAGMAGQQQQYHEPLEQRLWTCRGALLPWGLLAGINGAFEARRPVCFTLQTAPASPPRTYGIDFSMPAPYQVSRLLTSTDD